MERAVKHNVLFSLPISPVLTERVSKALKGFAATVYKCKHGKICTSTKTNRIEESIHNGRNYGKQWHTNGSVSVWKSAWLQPQCNNFQPWLHKFQHYSAATTNRIVNGMFRSGDCAENLVNCLQCRGQIVSYIKHEKSITKV